MSRLRTSIRLFVVRAQLAVRMVWRHWVLRPEELASERRRARARQESWNLRVQAVTELHWTVVQGDDHPAPLDPE